MIQRLINIYENYFKTKYDKNDKKIILYTLAHNATCICNNKYIIYLYENNHFEINNTNNNKTYKIIKDNYLYYTNIFNIDIVYKINMKYIGSIFTLSKLYKNNKLINKFIYKAGLYKYKFKYLYIYNYIYIIKFYNNKSLFYKKNNIYLFIYYLFI